LGPPLYFHHPSSLEHDTGVHPERAERIQAIEAALDQRDWLGFARVEAPAAPMEAITAIHPIEHVTALEEIAERGGGMIDLDTVMSEQSYVAALHSAGGAVAMVDALLERTTGSAFSGTRPPGHHALPDRAMGFCLLNNVAIAARRARDAHGVERILILDWDVHHGNGTNDIFHRDPAVLFCSIHQSPLYPGTGPAGDVGSGPGEGFTINLPVGAGAPDELFCSHVRHLVVPLIESWEPGLVLISAGYDAHRRDPVGGCALTEEGYARMTADVVAAAAEVAAPVGVVLEGGYDLQGLAMSVVATLGVLGGRIDVPEEEIAVQPETREAIDRFARWWPVLAG
jgi:acetoin utilization deacetylase AcuC-like enzyme